MSATLFSRSPYIWTLRKFVLLAFGVSVVQGSFGQVPSSVEGSVINGESGEPLPSVQVEIRGSTPDTTFSLLSPATTPSHSSVTDSRGRFVITGVPPGRYRAIPIRAGFVFLGGRQPSREPGVWVQATAGRTQNVTLSMVREGVISGRVGTANNAPLPEGTVATLLRYTTAESGERSLNWVPGIKYEGAGSFVKVNDIGEFRFYGLPPGDYYIGIANGPGQVFYPGTTRERDAASVHLSAGQHFRLETIVLSPSKAQVRLRFHASDLTSFSDASIVIDGGGSVIARPGTRIAELSFPVPLGPHEFFIRTVSDGKAYYATVDMVVGSDIDQSVALQSGFRITGNILRENERGELVGAPGVRCLLYAPYTPSAASNRRGCINADYPARFYRLELDGLAADDYVLSATANGRNVLEHGVEVDGPVDLKIVLGTAGGQVSGTSRTVDNIAVSGAVVVLVPDEPLRAAGPLYRTAIADSGGNFSIQGIRPGAYHIFAWPELNGAAYRSPDFMKAVEGRGKPLIIQKGDRISADVAVLDAND